MELNHINRGFFRSYYRNKITINVSYQRMKLRYNFRIESRFSRYNEAFIDNGRDANHKYNV